MTNHSKFEKKAKTNHFIALTFAILLHGAALYALTGSSNVEFEKFVPEFAKEWLDMDADKKETKTAKARA